MESITHIRSLLRLEFKVKHLCSTLTLNNLRFLTSLGNLKKINSFIRQGLLQIWTTLGPISFYKYQGEQIGDPNYTPKCTIYKG